LPLEQLPCQAFGIKAEAVQSRSHLPAFRA
jgi:hypothetical protein